MAVRALRWEGGVAGRLLLLDQTLLPREEREIEVRDVETLAGAIRRLAVRGAPAIGIAAAYGTVLALSASESGVDAVARVREAAAVLARARPTAHNLFWALDRVVARAESALASGADARGVAEACLAEARGIHAEDARQCRRMGEHAASLLSERPRVLTHCNTGALATGGIGTALAAVYVAAKEGRRPRVFACETRPLLQGARLTAWELEQAGIDVTLLVDAAAASLLARSEVDAVLVGADRIARNGDVANKVGTYPLAVLARRHGVPFYVVAPLSTFDPDAADGGAIAIEERSASEVLGMGRLPAAPPGTAAFNPAFDVTPAELVTALVTEIGRVERPDRSKVEALLRRAGRLAGSGARAAGPR